MEKEIDRTFIFLPSIRSWGAEITERVSNQVGERGTVVLNSKPGLFWHILNQMIDEYKPERFVWLADDIDPDSKWFGRLDKCWKKSFPDNIGLCVINDMHIRDGGAAFAMTSPNFLYVLFGRFCFPECFHHYYLDTLISDRAKELGLHCFCEDSIIVHKHPSAGRSEPDEVYTKNHENFTGDRKTKDRMDVEWQQGGREVALIRLEEIRKNI